MGAGAGWGVGSLEGSPQGKKRVLARMRKWLRVGQADEQNSPGRRSGYSWIMKRPSQGCPAEELPVLALVKLLPLLVVPLLKVVLLKVLPEVLAELPEVEMLPEVAELSEVARLWKGLLKMKGGLTEKRLPVVALVRKGKKAMLLGELWMVSMSRLLQMVSAWGLSGMLWTRGGATVAVVLGGMGAGSELSRSMSSQSCKQ
jgi:hypothetical protein